MKFKNDNLTKDFFDSLMIDDIQAEKRTVGVRSKFSYPNFLLFFIYSKKSFGFLDNY